MVDEYVARPEPSSKHGIDPHLNGSISHQESFIMSISSPTTTTDSTKTRTITTSRQHLIDTKINPSSRARIWTTTSYLFILIIGIPFWWITTSIERRPLPTHQVEGTDFSQVDRKSIPIVFNVDTELVPQNYHTDDYLAKLISSTEGYCTEHPSVDCGRFRFTSGVNDSTSTGTQGVTVRFESGNGESPYIASTGQHAGNLIIPIQPSSQYSTYTDETYLNLLIPLSLLCPQPTSPNVSFRALSDLIPSVPPTRPSRAIKYSQRLTLAFTLFNEDSSASGGLVASDWDIERATRDHLEPFLYPLRDLFDLTIESQIVWHAPLKTPPTKTEDGDWVVSKDHMKTFVNNEQWTLDSGSSNDPVLRFMLFVPSAKHTPLRLETSDHSPAFLIPQIGGVVIYHDTTTLGSKSTDSAALKRRLEAADLQLPIAYFAAQLYALLGVPPVDGRYADEHLRAHPKTLRPMDGWRKINFMRSIIGSNLQEATGTLISITRLVARIKEMVIKREVRVDVEGAVNALQKLAASTDAPTTLTDLFSAARDAAQLSNRAFFNPSMMGLLYFPDEHKYAVYTPLFAPVAVPILVALLKEARGWRQRRNRTT